MSLNDELTFLTFVTLNEGKIFDKFVFQTFCSIERSFFFERAMWPKEKVSVRPYLTLYPVGISTVPAFTKVSGLLYVSHSQMNVTYCGCLKKIPSVV